MSVEARQTGRPVSLWTRISWTLAGNSGTIMYLVTQVVGSATFFHSLGGKDWPVVVLTGAGVVRGASSFEGLFQRRRTS